MNSFVMNGYFWSIVYVEPNDPVLEDRTGKMCVATTDPNTYCIYLNATLHGEFLNRVLIHELGHAAMVSYHLIEELHRMVEPFYWIEMEEWICNFIADYGSMIFSIASKTLGNEAIKILPYELEKLVA